MERTPEGAGSRMHYLQNEKISFFEVSRTPPEEVRRRERELAAAQSAEVQTLLLTPFTQSPRLDFGQVKLGRAAVRRLVVRNPGERGLEVLLDKMPKPEKGFNVDYAAFRLGGREETELQVGWTPQTSGGVRDSYMVRFGKFSAQVVVCGNCVELESSRPAARVLGPRDTNSKFAVRRAGVKSSKLSGPAKPKVTIPSNPVQRQDGSPPKRAVEEGGSAGAPVKREGFVCGGKFPIRDFNSADTFTSQSPRRETFVKERPAPGGCDVVESTPIREEAVKPEFDSRLSSIMPPPGPDSRKQTFVPRCLPLPVQQEHQEEVEDIRRQTFVKLPEVPEQQPSQASAPQILSARPGPLADLLEQIQPELQPLDLSLSSPRSFEIDCTAPTLPPGSVYCPRVSDISLPDSEPRQAAPSTPLRDPRLTQLMRSLNLSGAESLNLSMGSQFGDCSLAVNVASPSRQADFEDELDEIEENKENFDEDEIDRLAVERGSSALSHVKSPHRQDNSARLSTETIVKMDSQWDANDLPRIEEVMKTKSEPVLRSRLLTNTTEAGLEWDDYDFHHNYREEEEETIEYEFEIVGGERRLMSERTVNRTVTSDLEKIIQSIPTAKPGVLDQSNCQMRPRSVDLTTEEAEAKHALLPDPAVRPSVALSPEPGLGALPGLRGSPRISNQVSARPESFLQVTVSEMSFLPPSPDDPRRCSTGVKNKEAAADIAAQLTGDIRKNLFQQAEAGQAGQTVTSQDFTPLSSLGHELPVIDCPVSADRLSSDTYIAGPADSGGLSTIGEESNSHLTQKSETNQEETSQEPSSSKSNRKDQSIVRLSAKAKRSNMNFKSRDIESIALPTENVNLTDDSVDDLGSGLQFISISPSSSEKRKQECKTSSEMPKRLKTDFPSTRPAVKAVKNPPSLLRSLPKKPVTKPLTKPIAKKDNKISVTAPPKTLVSRVMQPTKKLQLSKRRSLMHQPNPYATRNTYYDEKWVEKEEKGFSKWLNFILTPQLLEESTSLLPGSVDIAKLWSQCSKDVREPRAPTREEMSLRQYTARAEMNRLRKKACKIWQSKDVATVVQKVEFEIDKMRLSVRKDRNITKDIGMKQALLKLLLSYNPLWLRVGLETVYGELLPVGSNSDLLGLSRFIITRLLSNPDVLEEYAHPTVPHSYRNGCQDALNKFALKKFLELVYFLDIAKESKLIRHNPCLFCPDSELKTSRDILILFAKDYLAGEGDVTKHLAYMGYVVHTKQTKLDEFDFAVTNIKTDLRCGIRLTKLAELLTGAEVVARLRVPAVSRLQKIHNSDLGLAALRQNGIDVAATITAKDLVDGHREKTLELLWSVIFGSQLTAILDLSKLREEICHLRRSLAMRARLGEEDCVAGQAWLASCATRSPLQTGLADERLVLLLDWAKLVLAHYRVPVDNWTVAWSDGRALCLLVHHYQPGLLPRQAIQQRTSFTHQADTQNLDDSSEFSYGTRNLDTELLEALKENEKQNFKILLSKVSELGGVPVLITPTDMTNTIPDEKVTATFIGYLAVRLLDLSREIKAARTIQLAWRRIFALKKEEKMKVMFSKF